MTNCQEQCGDESIGTEQGEQRTACSKGVYMPAGVSVVVKTACPFRNSFLLYFICSEKKEGDED